jgi:polyribonucleotide nucleotidyltransferase
MRRGIQVVLTVLSYDEENSTDFVSLMAASTALSISDIPWGGPTAALRVVKKAGEFSINPLNSEVGDIEKGELDAFIAGTEDRINMIEMGGYEVREEDAAKACQIALEQFKELTQFQKDIVDKVGKEKAEVSIPEPSKEVVETARNFLLDKLDSAMYTGSKAEKDTNLKNLEGELKQFLEDLKKS